MGNLFYEQLQAASDGRCITIPENATNGDVMKMLFPDIITEEFYLVVHATTKVVLNGVNGEISYDFWKEWWNAKYKR